MSRNKADTLSKIRYKAKELNKAGHVFQRAQAHVRRLDAELGELCEQYREECGEGFDVAFDANKEAWVPAPQRNHG